MLGRAPSFATWMLLGFPAVILMLAGVAVALPRFFPSTLEAVAVPEAETRPLDKAAWIALVTTLVTIVGWFVGDRIGITPGTMALLPVLVFAATGMLRAQEVRTLPWDVLLLIGGGVSLGKAIDQSGLAAELATRLPLTALSPGLLVALVAVAFACSLSMPLPVSTPPNAMVFAAGDITARDMVILGSVVTLLGLGLVAALGPSWWALWGVV